MEGKLTLKASKLTLSSASNLDWNLKFADPEALFPSRQV